MADKNSLIQYVVQKVGPDQLKMMVDQAEQELSQDPDVTQEALAELEKQLTYLVENPETYPEFVVSAVESGMIDAEDLPQEFQPIFIAVILIAISELKNRMATQGSQMFAKGGLATVANQLAAKGRFGDTMLAHINPREAEVLRQMGGSGTINPHTGLPEFFFKKLFKAVKNVFKAVVKIAAPIVATVVAGPWAGAAVGALIGAGGGGGLKGALIGGLTGSLGPGGLLGNTAKALGTGVSKYLPKLITDNIGAQTLGAGLLGGAGSAALGQGFLPGALAAGSVSALTPTVTSLTNSAKGIIGGVKGVGSSAAGSGGVFPSQAGGLNQVSSNLLGSSSSVPRMSNAINAAEVGANPAGYEVYKNAMQANAAAGIPGFTNAAGAEVAKNAMEANIAAGIPGFTNAAGAEVAKNAMAANAVAGVPGFSTNASNIAASNIAGGTGLTSGTDLMGATTMGGANASPGLLIGGAAKDTGLFGTGISGSQALMGTLLLGGLTPQEGLKKIEEDPALTAAHKEAMSRALTNYTAKYNMTTLPQQGTPEYDDMMSNISQGIGITFMNPTITVDNTGVTQPMKRGGKAKAPAGGLSQIAMLASGTGSGRDDTINARLSDGEYVLDAETVALLGNGSTKAGAAVLDQMREQLRKQKGKALAKGKFSPDAKSPLAYMKGGLK